MSYSNSPSSGVAAVRVAVVVEGGRNLLGMVYVLMFLFSRGRMV